WRRYVDPVGIRVRAGEGLEVDATILPLVENSAYQEAFTALGAEPVSLVRPQAPEAIATFDVKLPSAAKEVGDLLGIDGPRLLGTALGDHASLQIADGKPAIDTDFAGMLAGPAGG